MKRSLLFLSLILCFAVVNAQNINVKQSRDGSVKSGQKTIVNPNHIPTTFKVVNNTKDPIPAGYARVTLTAGDVWGDGSGYQLLLDADATAYGVEIPTTGGLSDTSAASIAALATIYNAFEYKIPTNADGSLTTTNIVLNNSISIDVLPGTFDYVVTNPTPGDRMWIAGNGRGDDLVISEGIEYIFNVTGTSTTGDNVVIQSIDPNLPAASITWNFNDGVLPYDWRLYNVDGQTLNEEIASYFTTTNGWEILQNDEEGTDFIAAAASYFETAGTADRWIVTNQVNLQGGNYLQFDAMSLSSSYPESLEVKLATSGDQPSDFTTMLKSIESLPGGAFTTYTVDLSAYTGQVRFAFRLTSYDAYICLLDNIKVLGNASGLNDIATSTFGVYPNPANDFVTISDANGADVKVIDMLGRTLITKRIKSSNETISINDLQTGMYMIQMVKDGKVSSQKLIKK
ncbi:MAG: DUF2436 domain-containing protein [Bacteroidales bacterium]|jgi:hypothetical protein